MHSGSNLWKAVLIGLPGWLSISSPAAAQWRPAAEEPAVAVSGFATLGITHHDNHSAGVVSSLDQIRPAQAGWSHRLDSVAGLQVEMPWREDSALLVQAVHRASAARAADLRMAYLRHRIGDWGLRIGRIRSPLFMDSDIAEIGYANLMARQPIALYGLAGTLPHITGGDVQWQRSLGEVAVMAQAYAGSQTIRQDIWGSGSFLETRYRDFHGLAVSASSTHVNWRLSHSRARAPSRSPMIDALNAGLTQVAGGLRQVAVVTQDERYRTQADQVEALRDPINMRPSYTSVGVDANVGAWRVLGEWVAFKTRTQVVGRYRGHQLTLGRSLGDVTAYAGVARLRRTDAPADRRALDVVVPEALGAAGATLAQGAAQVRAASQQLDRLATFSGRSRSLGLRWDARERLAWKVQFDRISSDDAGSPGLLAPEALPFQPVVRLLSVSADIVF